MAAAAHDQDGYHCMDCQEFKDLRIEGLSKHLALTHCKLETLLTDEDLMAEKQV